MVRCVLDASAAVQFVLGDEFDAVANNMLRHVEQQGALVPTLWHFEVANALRNAERRGRISEAGLTHALRGLQHLRIQVDTRIVDQLRVIDVARQFDISAYDAAYLWVAMEMNLPLATRDERLAGAATAAGVMLV